MELREIQDAFVQQIATVDNSLAHWVSQQFKAGRSIDSVQAQMRRVMAIVGSAREDGKIILFAPREIPMERITNAIIGVFEGGYSPWIHSVEAIVPLALADEVKANGPWYANERFWAEEGRMRLTYDEITGDEGNGNGRAEVGLPEIISGLEKMAIHAARHFNDLMTENDDAITHDVMIQFVVLGEIIYG